MLLSKNKNIDFEAAKEEREITRAYTADSVQIYDKVFDLPMDDYYMAIWSDEKSTVKITMS